MRGCILLFGLPRSGTTWIGKLFDSHPDTLYRHEPDSVQYLTLPLYPEIGSAPQHREELQRFVALLPLMRSAKVVGKQPLFPKSYQSSAGLAAYRMSVAVAKAASRITRNFPCPYRPTAEGSGRARLVWKSIESSGRLGICIETLPDIRAIHLMRHPCGFVASMLRGTAAGRFGDPSSAADKSWLLKMLLGTASGKVHASEVGDASRFSPEECLAWCWVLIQEKILADVAGSNRVLTVRYEDVCADPIAMTRRMFEFTGLDWQPQTEAFVRASTQSTAHMTDYYSVFKSPQVSAERWRTELTPDVVERVIGIVSSSPLRHYYPDEARSTAQVAEEAT
ncbi:MAG TPA: sulfotransferase [Rhodanobacteraceae bacterium]|nr:sulfotransferase [Rhodanobacteraceae bacterium]